ncbi:hypothetical protein ACFFNY_14080 [Paenibacillus hodogayensis]|uniref:TetR family transcriptional regulator n=1 Tax=Paenibacillus hodogayensis TaxID=279208 RepID=A0ABV5VX18_9BACL
MVKPSQSAGATESGQLAQQLLLLFDGAMVAARMDRNTDIVITARGVAAALIAAALDFGER